METEMGTPEDAHRAKANATRAYGEFTKFLPMVEHHLSAKDRAEIEDMRNQLEQLLSLFSSKAIFGEPARHPPTLRPRPGSLERLQSPEPADGIRTPRLSGGRSSS